MTLPEQIDQWLKVPSENQHLEFKEAREQYDTRKASEYCVALANEGGGHLLLGIADTLPRKVIGTRAFRDPVKAADKLFQAVGFRVNIEEVEHPQGRVLVFEVPPRPRGTAYHLDGRYLMRSGASLVPMSEDQLRRIFAEGAPDWLDEPAATNLSAQQVVELLNTKTYFRLLNQPHPSEPQAVVERLVSERMVDRETGAYSIRRLGALLLAENLEDFPDIRRKAARVVVYPDKSKLETRLDQTDVQGYAVGFQGLIRFIMQQMPQNEVIENALRREATLVPEIVIRELVANALIHQDFTIGGASVMVEIYCNRVEISSPGEPMVPVERFIDGYETRNERLADLMRRMGICEERSSGIDRVIEAAEVLQLPPPEFFKAHHRTLARVFGPLPFEGMGRDDRIRACYQHCALRWVMGEQMTNQSLRERFKLAKSKTASVSQIIAATIDAGLIKPNGSNGKLRKYARYAPFWA